MKLDYARVSTEDQIRQLHRARLTVAGCEKVCEEKITGTARKRPELEKLLSEVSPSSGSERRTAYAMRKRGVRFGRPKKMLPDPQQLALGLKQGRSVSEVARMFNVHPATIYRIRDHQAPDFKLAS